MIADQVRSICHQMRLFGVHEAAERRAQAALADQQHPLEFLRLLLEDELLARRSSLGKRLTSKACFRAPADLEDLDLSYDRGLAKAKLKEISLLNFHYNRENLLLLGGTGVGKTHLAMAIGRRACQETVSTAFVPTSFLFEEAIAERAAGTYVKHIRKLGKIQLLILDDFGLRNYTHDEATILVDILEERYQKGSVIVTSQVSPDGWLKLFEDPVIAEAIVDRLRNPCQKLNLKGPTYRDRLAAKKQQQRSEKT